MPIEIERKFLVTGRGWADAVPTHYRQGYLNRDKNRTVRVRRAGDQAFITVKGISTGATRQEFEYSIPVADAEAMLELCDQPLVEKNRRKIMHAGVCWEIDEFLGVNAGLVIAEVELETETQTIDLPAWVGREVTDDPRYFNSNLVNEPFSTWGEGTT